jgi:hypothetical protein
MKFLKTFESFKFYSCWTSSHEPWYYEIKDIIRDRLQELDDIGCHIEISYNDIRVMSVSIQRPLNKNIRTRAETVNGNLDRLFKDINLDEIYDNLSAMISELKEKNVILSKCVLYNYIQEPLVIDLNQDHYHNELPPLKNLKAILTPFKFSSIFKPLQKNVKEFDLTFKISNRAKV